ncbi:MAG: nascent polypeptide-associated complex protein [Candidatus Altiarchaeales archaeon]|nr:MAG: nascent polypeptide-associated complex protein [Candidatus Altiarchaeales archaeon]
MFPMGLNPRQMKQMMKRFGIKVKELNDIDTVVLHSPEKDIVIEGAEVMKMVIQGQEMFQIIGGTIREIKNEEKEKEEIEITDEDVSLVAQQANVSMEEARKALEETKGDIAEAIIKLKSN